MPTLNYVTGDEPTLDQIRAVILQVNNDPEKILHYGAKILEEDGSQFTNIDNFVLNDFTLARDLYLSIRDVDLQTSVINGSEKFDMPSFKASKTWLKNFKRSTLDEK
ncbi:hypothetical protein FQA39_LY04636 [Lamprigera yunnana]|nr:hypothetical protein FQA39_LY04636 [Lamprigera yunnana]